MHLLCSCYIAELVGVGDTGWLRGKEGVALYFYVIVLHMLHMYKLCIIT